MTEPSIAEQILSYADLNLSYQKGREDVQSRYTDGGAEYNHMQQQAFIDAQASMALSIARLLRQGSRAFSGCVSGASMESGHITVETDGAPDDVLGVAIRQPALILLLGSTR